MCDSCFISVNRQTSGYLNLLANCIDNFMHGLAVAGGFLVSKKVRTAGNTCDPFQNNTSYKILNIIIANNWFSCVLFYSFIYFSFYHITQACSHRSYKHGMWSLTRGVQYLLMINDKPRTKIHLGNLDKRHRSLWVQCLAVSEVFLAELDLVLSVLFSKN